MAGDPHLSPGDEVQPSEAAAGDNVCPDCGGSGRVGEEQCATCEGRGYVTEAVGGG